MMLQGPLVRLNALLSYIGITSPPAPSSQSSTSPSELYLFGNSKYPLPPLPT